MNDKEIALELAKNKADEFVVKKELNTAKTQFINELKNGLGEEIKSKCNEVNKPIKIKKSLGFRLKNFFRRIITVLGN